MGSVRDLLLAGTTRLRGAGVETPRLDAELLLALSLGTSRSRLLASLEDGVDDEVQSAYYELIRRRAAREPVAYLTGVREFYGREFEVTRDTLIPRPETELLVELAIRTVSPQGGVAVDVGTGTGCVAVTLAAEAPGYRVYATDVSEAALRVARRNAERHGVADRVSFLLGSLLDPVPERADLILANLPYVPSDEIDDLQPEVSRWEPRSALDGGPDGLDVVRELLAQLPRVAAPRATCLLELDPRQFEALHLEVKSRLPGWTVTAHADLAGRERVAELRSFTHSS